MVSGMPRGFAPGGLVGILPRYMPIPTYSLDGVLENPRCGVDFLNLKLSEHLR